MERTYQIINLKLFGTALFIRIMICPTLSLSLIFLIFSCVERGQMFLHLLKLGLFIRANHICSMIKFETILKDLYCKKQVRNS